jgi:predicted dehydrogenase
MERIRTAVVGVGHLGKHHARWYKNINEAELIGVYDVDSAKCRRVAAELGVAALENIGEIYDKAQAVTIAVPTSSHFEVASEFIKRGVHCLIEKPIAASIEEAETLVSSAAKNNVTLAVGHIERFNPAIQALKNYDIQPRFIEAHRLAVFDPRGTDVAVILDLMIHDIELALHLIKSPPKKIEASAVAVISETADIANARISFENGAVANLTASRISLKPMRKLRIFQKSGYFSLDLAERQADIYRLDDKSDPGAEGIRIPLGKSGRDIIYNKAGNKDDDMLCLEITDFLQAIKSHRRPEVTGEEAAAALKVAAEIERIGLNISGTID